MESLASLHRASSNPGSSIQLTSTAWSSTPPPGKPLRHVCRKSPHLSFLALCFFPFTPLLMAYPYLPTTLSSLSLPFRSYSYSPTTEHIALLCSLPIASYLSCLATHSHLKARKLCRPPTEEETKAAALPVSNAKKEVLGMLKRFGVRCGVYVGVLAGMRVYSVTWTNWALTGVMGLGLVSSSLFFICFYVS